MDKIRCCTCKEFKTHNLFSLYYKNGKIHKCKSCVYKSNKKLKFKDLSKHKQKCREYKRTQCLQFYGVDEIWFENKLREQGNRCAICGCYQHENMTIERKFSVDHCHRTGINRGLLCCRCNAGLGQFKDSEQNLLNAIDYLKLYEKKQTSL